MEQNATYKQLMLLPSDELTEPQKLFLDVHNEMVMAGQKSAECFLIMANDMRRMKDEELYKAAGFETFKDYVETALKVKERQAYNWLSVLDLPEAYLSKNAGMGITKLTLIASASPQVAEELMEDEATSEKTVKELNAIIKEKEQELADATKQLRLSEDDLMNKDDQIRELQEELDAEREKNDKASEPVEVDTSAYEETIEALKGELEQAQKDLERSNSKLETAENRIVELKKQEPKVVTKTVEKTVEKKVEVENPETKQKLEQAQKDLSEAEVAAAQARAEKAEAEEKAQRAEAELTAYKKSQEAVAAFKVHAANLFDMWDTVIDAVNQIKTVDPEYATKCVAKLTAFSDTVKSDIEGVQ